MHKKGYRTDVRTGQIQGKVTVDEKALIAREAARRGMTVSAFVAGAAIREATGRDASADPVLDELRYGNRVFERTMELTLEGRMKTADQFRAMLESMR
jgi:hypothetical protein